MGIPSRMMLGGVVVATAVAAGRSAHATETPGLHGADRVDHHHRPPQYDDPNLAVPPASGADPDYPLAVAFVPAHSSNYTAGGIVSHDFVVVHTMQGYYAGSQSWFQNPDANVSAHYVMRSEDGEVTQMVRHGDRAWHVGNSNAYAIGIEHEGFIDDVSWYTWDTYLSSARLTRWLCEDLSIPVDRDHIVGHVELPNQTHTDPGPLWDWDLYMALIRDVVPQQQIHGVVVDRSLACTMTANADTWIKATLEDATDLGDGERCMIPSGTALTVLHASDPMVGHTRFHFDQDGSPCQGMLAEQGFAWIDDFDGSCDPSLVAAVGISVQLDGGAPVPVDEEGRFVLTDVAAGGHMLDTMGDAYADGLVPLDVDVYPGARVVIGVDPLPDGGGSGDDDGGADDGNATDGEPPGGTADDAGGDDLPSDGGPPPGSESGQDTRALPPGFGEDDGNGCGCTHAGGSAPVGSGLALLLLMWRRRRPLGR
ncbi:MAG: N-acetylmuramoyl-L-alanine amidase [Deltaproteobacteria bacterium]|nr:N-acetylmuramoyl-L-alanine amidase [Deltaproteobacteria bacterium]